MLTKKITTPKEINYEKRLLEESYERKLLEEIFGVDDEKIEEARYNYEFHKYCSGKLNTATIEIEDVIFNDPATIVKWSDGSKTVVKCDGDKFDQEKGLAMAIIKRILGNTGSYYDVFREYCSPEYVREKHSKSN